MGAGSTIRGVLWMAVTRHLSPGTNEAPGTAWEF